jgi:hypothetical protein
VVERALEVRHRDALVDDEALELVERGQVRRVELVGAVDAPRAEHVDAGRSRSSIERTCTGARVRAQHEVPIDGVDEERVLHLARRVVDVEVQRVEVEPLVLELRALGDLPAHADEEVRDLLLQEETGCRAPTRARGAIAVMSTRSASSCAAVSASASLAGGQRLRDAAAGLTDELAERGLLLVRDVPQLCVQLCERGRLAGVGRASGLQLGGGGCRVDRRDGVGDRGIHGFWGDQGCVRHERRVYRRGGEAPRGSSLPMRPANPPPSFPVARSVFACSPISCVSVTSPTGWCGCPPRRPAVLAALRAARCGTRRS